MAASKRLQSGMGMPRSSLMNATQDSGQMTILVAQAVALAFTLGNIVSGVTYIPIILRAYAARGIQLPWILVVTQYLNWWGIVAIILIVNAIIFFACAWAARRWWIGMAFLAPIIYLFVSSLFAMSAAVPLISYVLP